MVMKTKRLGRPRTAGDTLPSKTNQLDVSRMKPITAETRGIRYNFISNQKDYGPVFWGLYTLVMERHGLSKSAVAQWFKTCRGGHTERMLRLAKAAGLSYAAASLCAVIDMLPAEFRPFVGCINTARRAGDVAEGLELPKEQEGYLHDLDMFLEQFLPNRGHPIEEDTEVSRVLALTDEHLREFPIQKTDEVLDGIGNGDTKPETI
jgi:hypothetical protein